MLVTIFSNLDSCLFFPFPHHHHLRREGDGETPVS